MPTEVAGECEAPRYPVWAARAKISAEVRLAITVGTDGNVRGVEIISSNGHRTLIEQAARAVWSWRYSPAMRDGETVECVVHKTIIYVPDL
jgi:protein TonB